VQKAISNRTTKTNKLGGREKGGEKTENLSLLKKGKKEKHGRSGHGEPGQILPRSEICSKREKKKVLQPLLFPLEEWRKGNQRRGGVGPQMHRDRRNPPTARRQKKKGKRGGAKVKSEANQSCFFLITCTQKKDTSAQGRGRSYSLFGGGGGRPLIFRKTIDRTKAALWLGGKDQLRPPHPERNVGIRFPSPTDGLRHGL